jgi:epoxyqueuosine reductase
MDLISRKIKEKAKSLGFYACGIAEANSMAEEAIMLKKWLDDGKHAGMDYMENYFDKRTDPRKLLESARSVIVLLYNYYPGKISEVSDNFKVSKYAYGTDYHFVLKKKLKSIIEYLHEVAGDIKARAFVDSAPVLERSWAEKAGLGWIGKNTCLITKERGSYFFIGEIITDLKLKYDTQTVPDYCGGCTRCIEACPTKALSNEGLDANRCISYWTIEHKGENISPEFKGEFQYYIFGCDICQDVCPWNRLAEKHNEDAFKPLKIFKEFQRSDWSNLTPEMFNKIFKKSPVKRAKYKGLMRNIAFINENNKSPDDIESSDDSMIS